MASTDEQKERYHVLLFPSDVAKIKQIYVPKGVSFSSAVCTIVNRWLTYTEEVARKRHGIKSPELDID